MRVPGTDNEQLALFGMTDLAWEQLPEGARRQVVDLYSQMIRDHLRKLSAMCAEEGCHEREDH